MNYITELCSAPMNYIMYRCEESYSILREDTGHYLGGWKEVDTSSKYNVQALHFFAFSTDVSFFLLQYFVCLCVAFSFNC